MAKNDPEAAGPTPPRPSLIPGQGRPAPAQDYPPPPPPEPEAEPDDEIEDDEDDAVELAPNSLADHLERTRRHPVILFGVSQSGKTTLLMSLVQALNRSSEVNIYLGDPILPAEDPAAEDTHEQAITFFERDAQAFTLGQMVPPTRATNPYFIPVDVERKSDGRVVRLALMEGKGEWYAPIKGGKKGSMFRKFMKDLADVLELYGESITVLWCAPYMVGTKAGDTGDSDLGLLGAITAYRKHRAAIGQDFHLFLLNKWDCYAAPLEDKPQFSTIDADTVEGLIQNLYPNTWPKFEALALKNTGRRFFMQYASGHIVGGRVRVPPARHRPAFDRYPRTVWNWLYGNATQTELGAESYRSRETLFPDVLPQPPRRETIIEWVSRKLLGR